MVAQGGATPEERIAWGFQRATCRPIKPQELAVLTAGFQKHLARFKQEPEAAVQLVSIGASKADPNLNTPELAAYALTANVMLNLDEVVTRE